MKLVIAEKPSVAQSLAAVIGATARKDGYLEGGGWRVSWCVGHLAGLADADAYNPDYAKWRYDDLPILPEPWQMVVSKDKKKQFDVLKQLMNAPDVTEVVNACDAGREGELIFRAVYELAGCQKPMKRLWISSMEDSAIREGFANLRPGADYDGLRDAALCRAKADWLVGINATRLFSVLYHRTLNIGRVMSPTLALIVQREAEIDTFKPVPFYTVTLELPGFSVSGERMADKVAAQQLKTACQGAAATVKKVERKDKSEKPPALYDLTTLQRDANRLLGFTAQQTLDYLQNLYEKKLCTYPDGQPLPDFGYGSESAGAGPAHCWGAALCRWYGACLQCGPGHQRQESDRPPCGDPYPQPPGRGPDRPAGGRKGGAGAGGSAAAVRRGPTLYLCGNRRCCRVRRCGVYRQGPHGETTRLAGAGRCIPRRAEKCRTGNRGQGSAGAV